MIKNLPKQTNKINNKKREECLVGKRDRTKRVAEVHGSDVIIFSEFIPWSPGHLGQPRRSERVHCIVNLGQRVQVCGHTRQLGEDTD